MIYQQYRKLLKKEYEVNKVSKYQQEEQLTIYIYSQDDFIGR